MALSINAHSTHPNQPLTRRIGCIHPHCRRIVVEIRGTPSSVFAPFLEVVQVGPWVGRQAACPATKPVAAAVGQGTTARLFDWRNRARESSAAVWLISMWTRQLRALREGTHAQLMAVAQARPKTLMPASGG